MENKSNLTVGERILRIDELERELTDLISAENLYPDIKIVAEHSERYLELLNNAKKDRVISEETLPTGEKTREEQIVEYRMAHIGDIHIEDTILAKFPLPTGEKEAPVEHRLEKMYPTGEKEETFITNSEGQLIPSKNGFTKLQLEVREKFSPLLEIVVFSKDKDKFVKATDVCLIRGTEAIYESIVELVSQARKDGVFTKQELEMISYEFKFNAETGGEDIKESIVKKANDSLKLVS